MELSKGKFSIYSSLDSAKMRRKHGLFSVEGEKSVHDILGYFEIDAVICISDTVASEFTDYGANVYEVRKPIMQKLSNLSNCPNVMAICHIPVRNVENENSLRLPDDLYMVLDGIQDPGNLGTIVRTCHWFGIKRIFASRDTVDIFNPKTVQSTMGSLAKVRVDYVNLAELFDTNPGLPVYGTLLDGENIFKTSLGPAGFILMGNEGKGISPELREKITRPLLIPPANEDHSESLNVAVAAAITIAQFRK